MSAITLKVTTKTRPNSRIAVSIEVPVERCKAGYEAAISRLSRSIKIPGFRKGKVPRAVILQQIGVARIRATALEALIDGVWKEALKQESIEPLCEPELEGGFESLFDLFTPDSGLSLTLETDISPNPILKQTKGLKAEADAITFDPAKVDELIEESRKQLATLVPVENRKAKMGDVAVLSFQGKFKDDDSDIEGGSAESMDIDLEAGRMIPGFIEGIVDMGISDTKTIECEFPNDYSEEKARGRKASFHVTLNDLKTRELPNLDDAFAKQASDKENLAEMRKDLETRLKDDAERRNQNNKQEALLKSLVKELEVELPKSLIDQEVRNIVEQTASRFAQQGIDVKSMFTEELVKSLMDSSREEAENNIRQNLAIKKLAEMEAITVEGKEAEKKLKELNKQLTGEKNINQQRLQQIVEEDLLQEKVFLWLKENNTVVIKTPEKSSEKTTGPKSTKDKKKGTKATTKSS